MSHILAGLAAGDGAERTDALVERAGLRLERIASPAGYTQPPGQWCDEDGDEWVLVLRGRAQLEFAGGSAVVLNPGDHLLIPAHCRHRVAWTDPGQTTVWLALHAPTAAPGA